MGNTVNGGDKKFNLCLSTALESLKPVLIVAVFILLSEVSHEVSALGKEEVAHTSTK